MMSSNCDYGIKLFADGKNEKPSLSRGVNFVCFAFAQQTKSPLFREGFFAG